MITDISQLDPKGTYTYADYLTWRFEESLELIKGHIYRMSPAPRTRHQRTSMRLSGDLYAAFRSKSCEVYSAPFDVRLPNPDYQPGFNNKIYTVVQPDISVVCDRSKIDELGCLGAPDWVIEITSPSTHKKDFNEKFDLYESAGVREYWIAVPKSNELYVYSLKDGSYEQQEVYEQTGMAVSSAFPDVSINVEWIFGE